MQQFFVTAGQVRGEQIYIEGSDVNHMKNVLRMHPGESVRISDGDNRRYICQVKEYTEEQAILTIIEEDETNVELASRIYLFQGLPKGDKMEMIVQKAVELGVYKIAPVAMKRCVVRLDDKKAAKKVDRWGEIAKSAAKQSGRGIVPKVGSVLKFEEAVTLSKELDVVFVPYELAEGMEETKRLISAVKPGQSVGVFIGPEGGFEKDEVERLKEAGASEITLGSRILRTETAGMTALSILMYHLEG